MHLKWNTLHLFNTAEENIWGLLVSTGLKPLTNASLHFAKAILHMKERIAQVFIVHSEPLVQTGFRPKEMVSFSGLSADVQSPLAMFTRNNFLYIVLIPRLGFD